ncbi:condensation protein [Streptomyces sp. NPDC005805]|uniref:condensation protein n=1 Tax=Streptomyces sp. NPDC005805 TaxID=3157068 RepID=UPI003411EBB0
MTALHEPAGAARARGGAGGGIVPFPVVDEIARHCTDPAEPDTVHIEIHLPGRPDPARLREAVAGALARHPRVLVRERARGPYALRYAWELTGAPDTEVVSFPPAAPGALDAARGRALAEPPPLTASPPLRLEVVEEPGRAGCVLLFTLHHAALDGPACLRIAATAAELYAGEAGPVPAPAARAASGPAAPPPVPGAAYGRPARVAAGTPGPSAPGNGMTVCELAVPRREPGAPYTVNDQLMVATALTVAEWNRLQGAPAGPPLRITMPVDDRPRGPEMPIGNGTRLVEVPFSAEETGPDADPRELLRRTAERTRALKAVPRPPLGSLAGLLTAPVVPVAVRAKATRALRRAAGPWTSTTLLSNIGRIPYPLDFGDAGRASAVWFSAPARMPRGLTFTTASTGGRLHLALRWSRSLLGDADGARLRELFTERLAATDGSATGGTGTGGTAGGRTAGHGTATDAPATDEGVR